MPRVSATIWACIVRVPWPISVEATRMRAPPGVSSSDAFEASLTSPPPVKPEPWKKSASPMPRSLPESSLRRRLKSVRRTASRSTGSALQSLPSFWPVAVVSPVRNALTSRRRTGSMPRASAILSMWTSEANCVCGAPKPRKAPLGGVLVIVTRPRMRASGQRYGPVACRTPRERTTGESVT